MKEWWKENQVKVVSTCIEVLIILIGSILAGYAFGGWIQHHNAKNWNDINGGYILLAVLIIEGVNAILLYLWFKDQDPSKAKIKRSLTDKTYGDARFLIDERSKASKDEILAFNQTYPSNCVGWVVKANYKKAENKTKFNLANVDDFASHVLVLGATRSGKTQIVVLLTILANAKVIENNKTKKPSFVINDIKGELCKNTYTTLKENGYEVLVLNLKNTAFSNTWNPLLNATKAYIKGCFFEKEAESVVDNADMTNELRIKAEQEKDHASNVLREIVYLLFPVNDPQNAIWDVMAQNAFLTAYYYSLENFIEQYIGKKTYSEINQKTVLSLCTNINIPSIMAVLNNREQLRDYFMHINTMDDDSEAKTRFMHQKSWECGAHVFLSAENTLASAFANLQKGLSDYGNEAIKKLISTNEINLDQLASEDKPRAVFLIIAEGDEKSYQILTMFIDQLYTACIKKAEEYKNNKLPRDLLIVMDEFCNMPKLTHASQFFTLGAGRGILAMAIIQSINQLNALYQKDAKTIMENCALHLYLKSIDQETNQYYSKWAGHYTAESTSISKQNNNPNGSANESLKEMPLLTPDELANNKMGYLIAFSMKNKPAYIHSDMYYQCYDLNHKQIDNEAKVVKMNTTIVKEHMYNPYVFKESKYKLALATAQLIQNQKWLLMAINAFIDVCNNEINSEKSFAQNTSIQKAIVKVNDAFNNDIKMGEYKKQIQEVRNGEFLLFQFIKNHEKELHIIRNEQLKKRCLMTDTKQEDENKVEDIKQENSSIKPKIDDVENY